MWQIACAIGLANKLNDYYCIPENQYFPHLQKCRCGVVTAYVYKEPSFEYNEIAINHSYILLSGWFQSEKYWSHCKDEVIKAFNITPVIREGWVSIHVRRGDYLLKPDYHPVITNDYIKRAIEYFIFIGYTNFLVFGDDPDWNHDNINGAVYPGCNFEYSEGRTALEDMAFMAGCEHNIIANSSFSFWGAYLNKNPNKVVIAPSLWFGPTGPPNTNDLIPENWIRV